MKIPEALTERRFLQYLSGKPRKCMSLFCFSVKPMSICMVGALKIARVIYVFLQINFLLENEKYVFFTFRAYHFAASAITKGVFNATKDYASPFDVDGHGMLRRIDGRAHDSTLLS